MSDDDAATKAKESEEEQDEAKKEMEQLEEGDPPENLEDWPDGKAKYETFGGPEGPDDVLPFLENVLRGRNAPRERLLEVPEH